jgi:hypothetical protein
MTSWGLSPADLVRLRAGHREFTAVALAEIGDERGQAGG